MSKIQPLTWREVFSELLSVQKKIYVPELAEEDYDEDFRPGLIHGLFFKRDERLTGAVFDAISSRLDSEDFKDQVVALVRNGFECDIRDERTKIAQAGHATEINLEVLRAAQEKLADASWSSFESQCEQFYDAHWCMHAERAGDADFFKKKFLLFSIAKLLLEHLSRHDGSRFVVPRESLLFSEYGRFGVDLLKVDDQFNSYGLLTVVDDIEFSAIKPLEPFDRRTGKHVTLDSEGTTVLDLVELQRKGAIGTLSFRPRFNLGLRGGTSLNIALEGVERGALFDLSKLNEPEVTKLYSQDYDTLWVKVAVGDITFEEMVQDFAVEGDYIVTQVVHLQHSRTNNVDFINHIDHEFIYYTPDEYEARTVDPNQKGEARSRIKTFKVDNAKIPFTLSDGRWFLYSVLERHFQNIDLVREYFQNVL